MSEFSAAQIQFQTKRELESLRKNYDYIGQKILRLVNSRSLRVACTQLRRDLYRDDNILLAPIMGIWEINYKQERNAFHHYTLYISDTGNMLTTNIINFYLVPDGKKNSNGFDTYTLVDSSEYQLAVNKFELENGEGPVAENYRKAIAECKTFAADLQKKVIDCKSWKLFKELVEEMTNTYTIKSYREDKYLAVLTQLSKMKFETIDFDPIIDTYIVPFKYNEKSIESFKSLVVAILKAYYDRSALIRVRKILQKKLETNGIESIVDVEVDSSVDLHNGYVISLINDGTKSYEQIIKESFYNIYDPEKLEKSIVQLLKVYYEFKHISKKNAEFLLKFLKKYGITSSQFFNSIVEVDPPGAWEYMNPSQRKDYKNYAPEKYRFKKYAVLMKRRYGSRKDEEGKYELMETTAAYDNRLLEKMKAVAIAFNEAEEGVPGDTEILDIHFDPDTDDGFIFDFISYKLDAEEPDGRRLSAFTAMFNRSLPDIGTIYLDYKN